MKKLLLLIFIICLSIFAEGDPLSPTVSSDDIYATVSYCELIRSPDQYTGKVIRVSGIYRYGFEWSELYCLECLSEGTTWIDFDESFNSSTKAELRNKIGENGSKGRTVRVTMVGKFDGRTSNGHLGAYKFYLRVYSLEKAEVILNDGRSPYDLPKKVRMKAHCLKN